MSTVETRARCLNVTLTARDNWGKCIFARKLVRTIYLDSEKVDLIRWTLRPPF